MAAQKIGKKSRKRKRRKKNTNTTITIDPIDIRYGQSVSFPFNLKDPEFLKTHGFDPNSSVNVKMQLQMSDTRVKNRWIEIPENNLTGIRFTEDGIQWDTKGLPPDPTEKSIRGLFPIETNFDVQGIPVSVMRFSTLHFQNAPNSVVKFTYPEHVPLFSRNIQLGTPAYYRSRATPNTENTRDGLESIIDDEFASKPYKDDSFFMYCTTIADDFCTGRKIQEGYQSATRIDNPSEFAKVLGQEFAEQFIIPFRDQHSHEGLHLEVVHGYVHYIEETDEKMDFTGFMRSLGISHKYVPYFLPFLKRKRFDYEREYRFVIRPIGCTIKDDVPDERRSFLLKTSKNVFKLMSWAQPPIPEELILLYHDRGKFYGVRSINLNTNESRDINTIKVKEYINLELLDVNVSQFSETGTVSIRLLNGALCQGDVVDMFAFGVMFKGYPLPIVLQNINFFK